MRDKWGLRILGVERMGGCWRTVGTALSIIPPFITLNTSISIGKNSVAHARRDYVNKHLKYRVITMDWILCYLLVMH